MGKKAKNGEVSAPEYRIAEAIGALVAGKGVLLADDENGKMRAIRFLRLRK